MSILTTRICQQIAAMALTGLLIGAAPASGQSQNDAPPYEAELMRLSEVLGALHFLRPLCGFDDLPSWRDRMETFLDAETLEGNRRRRFIERFNQGHRGFSSVYRQCTASARLAMEQYVTEGSTLIRDVTSRYGR